MSGFAGDGGPPPESRGGTGGGGKNDPMFGFSESVTRIGKDKKPKTFDKRIKPWKLRAGDKNAAILMLDPKGSRYTVTLHDFTGPDGKYGSLVRCIARSDERGCPLCQALADKRESTGNDRIKAEARWFWALTAIDQRRFVFDEGTSHEKVYTNLRRLVLVTEQQYPDLSGLEDKEADAGWRGRTFSVDRSEDKKSYKLGTTWYPTNAGSPKTDAEMAEELADAAATYGLPVESFTAPVDYDVALKAPTFEEMTKIAAQVSGTSSKGVTVPEGDSGAVSY
jgi:hypothetical protein